MKPKTLAQLGISYDQSSHWKELAGIPDKDIEESLPVKTGKRTSAKKIIQDHRPKPDPEKLRRQKLASLVLNLWGRVGDIPDLLDGEPISEVVGAMDAQLLNGLTKSIPKAFEFLERLEKEILEEELGRELHDSGARSSRGYAKSREASFLRNQAGRAGDAAVRGRGRPRILCVLNTSDVGAIEYVECLPNELEPNAFC